MPSSSGDHARGYHHGDLRSALMRAALDELRTTGPGGLSLRRVARRAGVSHAAPTHHFIDKRGLFTALAAEGFAMLHRRTTPALAHDRALVEVGRRYVEFALEHPSHFAVMFDATLLDAGDDTLSREQSIAFDVLFQAIRAATGVADEDDLARQTVAAWLVVHGVATLWLSGCLPYDRDPRLVPAVFDELAPALVLIAEVGAAQAGEGRDTNA